MSSKLFNAVYQLQDDRFNGTRKAIFAYLAFHAKSDGTGICLSAPQVAKATSISVPTVRRTVRWLRELGYLIHDGWTDEYIPRHRLNLDMLQGKGDE